MSSSVHSIGIQGQRWAEKEKILWSSQQTIKRSYQDEVVAKLVLLTASFDMIQYGSLSIDARRYPLYIMQSK